MSQYNFINVAATSPDLALAAISKNLERHKERIATAWSNNDQILVFPELSLTGVSCGDLFLQREFLQRAESALAELVEYSQDFPGLLVVAGLPFVHLGQTYNVAAAFMSGELLALVPKTTLTSAGNRQELRYFASPTTAGQYNYVKPAYLPAEHACLTTADKSNQVSPATAAAKSPHLNYPPATNSNFASQLNSAIFSNHNLLVKYANSYLNLAIVVGADIYSNNALIGQLLAGGAELILNPQAEASLIDSYDLSFTKAQVFTSNNNCALVQSFASAGESTALYVYEGHNYIAELGEVIQSCRAESFRAGTYIESLINLNAVRNFKQRNSSGPNTSEAASLNLNVIEKPAFRNVQPNFSTRANFRYPFLQLDSLQVKFSPAEQAKSSQASETTKSPKSDATANFTACTAEGQTSSKVIYAQAQLEHEIAKAHQTINLLGQGLARRFRQIGAQTMQIGVSGGLDSTIALLVCLEACQILGISKQSIEAVTMPGFGSSQTTKSSAWRLLELLDIKGKEISIIPATTRHFADIGHDINTYDLTFENAQARERTQILMDLANKHNGLVIGTGDLSEIALGWSTYNGDQMSMYAVNASLPKTTMRYILLLLSFDLKRSHASKDLELAELFDTIVATPVSPELLPTDQTGNIKQKTEDKIGSYTLHDFFIYHYCYRGNSIEDTFALAKDAFSRSGSSTVNSTSCNNCTFSDSSLTCNSCLAAQNKEAAGATTGLEYFSAAEIKRVFSIFIHRLYTQQFKRKAFPDAIQVTRLSLSSTSDWQMPSDLDAADFFKAVDELEL